ncbi:MAG: GNAT family N-acetyltransferase [Oscillospiraceae bacterium]|nr:GNAT family N-acetyltransferase [Oscillospiraceae bacterium]
MDFIIRPVQLRDAADIYALRTMPGVFENTLGMPSMRLADFEKRLANMDANTHQMVAVETASQKVIGMVGLTVDAHPRKRHCAGLGIMVATSYQHCGVGLALMQNILDLADNWLMLRRVELGVYADNTRALMLYEKVGFVQEGRLCQAVARNGAYVDEIWMGRLNPALNQPRASV